MGESKNCVVKNDGGNNNYVIYLSVERDFTHTIIEDSMLRGKHKFTGRIIIRRSKPGDVAEMKLYLVEPKSLIKVQIRCKLRSLDIEGLRCSSERILQLQTSFWLEYKRSTCSKCPIPL